MNLFGKRRIFLDYAAGENNPSAIYKEGVEARKKLEGARAQIARALECQKHDVIFTSGGTESNNLAIHGVVGAATLERGVKAHMIISLKNHPSVIEPAKKLAQFGVEVDFVEPEHILSKIKENTVLISVPYVDNETGAMYPVPAIARAVTDYRRKHGTKYPYIHTDASAAYEYLEVNINKLPADLLSIEKALVVRPHVELRPQIVGGGQERGLRAGTENISSIAEFAHFFAEAQKELGEKNEKASKLKEVFLSELARLVPSAEVNTPEKSVPHIVSITLPGKLHEFVAIQLDERGVAVSTGSSCSSVMDEEDKEALRFSFGPRTSESEIREALSILADLC